MTDPTDPSTAPEPPQAPRRGYYLLAVLLLLVGLAVGILLAATKTTAGTLAVEDVTAFAILYVLAQSIERVTELAIPALDWVGAKWSPKSGSQKKAKENKTAALRVQRTAFRSLAVSGLTAAAAGESDDSAAKAKKEAAAASKELGYVASMFSFALAFVAASYFAFSLVAEIGFSVPGAIGTVITATAIMGGSTALHELISRIQKAKEQAEVTT